MNDPAPRPRPAAVLARWGGVAAGAGLVGVAGAGLAWSGGPIGRGSALLWLLFGAACLGSGEVLRRPRPADPVGLALSAAGLLLLAGAAAAHGLPAGASARLAALGGFGAFPLAVLLFPARPVPRVAGPIVAGAIVVLAAAALVRPTDSEVAGSLGLVIALILLGAIWWRYEGAADRDRRALLWFVAALGVTGVAALPSLFILDDPVLVVAVAMIVPASLAVGVLRPDFADVRLFTVRAVVAGVAVLLYLAVFSGIVASVRSRGAEPSAGALAIIGVALAAAFQPTRAILQGVIDELLFGDRADHRRAMTGVGERLSDDPVLALRALRQSLVLPYAALVADGTVVASSGTSTTPTRSTPLQVGAAGGELVVGLRAGELRLRASDETVLDVVAPALGQALHARLLTTELRRSRGEVISVVEEERRRLRRDLHDGLGPTLTGVAYAADAARNLLGTDPAAADTLLADLRTDTANAIAEVRRLVEGLRPPMLDELGLTQAIRQRARQLRTADGRALVVALSAPDPLPDVPAAVEVVAFRIVVEALTNVCRHAASDRAAVTLQLAEGHLSLDIRDDGAGTGPWIPGVGLTSMRERAESVGGTCTAAATPTGGHITAFLPIARHGDTGPDTALSPGPT
jgi:signal transduction histidine kinase